MSIRLRLTLLYSLLLALTLFVFGAALYTIQAQGTLTALKRDLILSGENLNQAVLRTYLHPAPPPPDRLPPERKITDEQAFRQLREREIARVLDSEGTLIASPFAYEQAPLPLSPVGLETLHGGQVWWEIASWEDERLLIYNRPVIIGGAVTFIVQVARSLAEHEQSLATLSRTLGVAGLFTIVIAFGIGWWLAGTALRPIHRITQTAQAIGQESDFARRVDYVGPDDEIGRLATTFNAMLARLQQAYQHVSQVLNLQRNFVADVSHELRTPLTTIRGNLALLRRVPALPAAEQADVLTDMEAESERLIRLVSDLLILARAEARPNLKQKVVPIRPVIAEACRQARQLDQQREIVEAAQEVTALADRDALKQIILILLDNALKHSHGTITVTAMAAGERVLLQVQDAGPGIAAELLPHVFDRFYRGEVESGTPGLGLGLPIAKAMVESMGGTIAIASHPGRGSIVSVHLPANSAP